MVVSIAIPAAEAPTFLKPLLGAEVVAAPAVEVLLVTAGEVAVS